SRTNTCSRAAARTLRTPPKACASDPSSARCPYPFVSATSRATAPWDSSQPDTESPRRQFAPATPSPDPQTLARPPRGIVPCLERLR
ncbi:hypothetical protein BE221DRAFT_75987, partial [Ostreococcus tauri]